MAAYGEASSPQFIGSMSKLIRRTVNAGVGISSSLQAQLLWINSNVLYTHYGTTLMKITKRLDLAIFSCTLNDWLSKINEVFTLVLLANGIDIDSQDGGIKIDEDDTVGGSNSCTIIVNSKIWRKKSRPKTKGNGASEMNPIAMWNRTNPPSLPPIQTNTILNNIHFLSIAMHIAYVSYTFLIYFP